MPIRRSTKYLALILVFIATAGLGCKGGSAEVQKAHRPVSLNWWGVWDTSSDVAPLIGEFKKKYPTISVNYRKFRLEEYEQALLEAWADDEGPDIFAIPSSWTHRYKKRIINAPRKIDLPTVKLEGTVKKELVPSVETVYIQTVPTIKSRYVPPVADDVIIDNQLYGLPISVDTMALFYNQDLLDRAGVPLPPTTWGEFKEAVKKITRVNSNGEIIQAGAGFGVAKNVSRAVDILYALMRQNGSEMITNGSVSFHSIPKGGNKSYNPGAEALRFYTDFAQPIKEVYTWNSKFPNSLEAFINRQIAFYFGYSYDLKTINARAPKLRYSVSQLPQIDGTTGRLDVANYWVNVVAKKSENKAHSWGFVDFISQPNAAIKYLDATNKPTARRELIDTQIRADDPYLPVFASQLLTSDTWYHGADAPAMENLMGELIDKVATGQAVIDKILPITAEQVQQTLR